MSWKPFFSPSRKDRDRAEEIDAHLDQAVQHYIAEGLTPTEARRQARLRFGNPRAHREALDELARLPIVDLLTRDLRYAGRMLRRAPAFSVTVIVTLALVIGATTAVFSLANAILLRPLPYPDADRLAIVQPYVKTLTDEYTSDDVDGAMWEVVRDKAATIDAAASADGAGGVNFVSHNSPSFVRNMSVGAGYFRVLGVAPFMGREFTRKEDQPGGPALAILSYAFWKRGLQSSSTILGQSILLRGEPVTVIGVMPDGFRGPEPDVDVWTPLRLSTREGGRGTNWILLARLNPGNTWTDAWRELRSFGKEPFRLINRYQRDDIVATLIITPMQTALVSRWRARDPIVMLSWAVGIVLLIACVNIAALQLARGGSRSKELATRMALGSGRGAVIRQLMVESVVMAIAGGSLGLLVGALGLEWLKTTGGQTFSEWKNVTLDGPTLAVTAGLSLLTSAVFGLVPARQASRIDVQAALVDGGSRSIAGGSRHLMRRVLVVAEVALGVVMLVAAGLLLRQFSYLQSLDPGFTPNHLYSASVSLADARYTDPAAINRLFNGSIAALQQEGMSPVSVSWGLPYQRLLNVPCDVEGRPKNGDNPSITSITYVTPGFFETFGIAIKTGRALNDRDRVDSTPVVVVNEMFAKIYFGNQSALGNRLLVANGVREIVGLSANVQQFEAGYSLKGMANGPVHAAPTVYIGASQAGMGMLSRSSPVWTVHASSSVQAGIAIQQAISAIDPLLPIGEVRSMSQVTARAMAAQRLLMTLVGVLATAAILLAAIGLHGLIAHSVAERTREFGIRLALGATAGQTVVSVAQSGVVLAAIGAIVGGALSVPAAHLIESSLFTVSTHDTTTYVSVTVLLFAVATASSVLPTLKVLRLDPAKTLRE